MSQQVMHQNTLKDQLGHFGRNITLLFNRAMMYQKSHPLIKESIDNVHKSAVAILSQLSPLVFILNRGQFFIDEEVLDPRINVARIVALFKAVGIQSIAFTDGLTTNELGVFLDFYSKLTKSSDVEEIKAALSKRGVHNIKINHVTYKKVTEDDQVVSRDALKNVAPLMDVDDQQNRKKFLDALLESVLSEELTKTLSISNIMANPSAVSQNMIEADLAGAQKLADGASRNDLNGYNDLEGDSSHGLGPGAGPGQGVGLGPGLGSGNGPGAGSDGGTGVESLTEDPESPDPDMPATLSQLESGEGPATEIFEGDTLVFESGKGFDADVDVIHGPPPDASVPDPSAVDDSMVASHGGSGNGPSTQSESFGAGDLSDPSQASGIPEAEGNAGALLVHQLDHMQQEVERHLRGEGDEDVDMSDLAFAIFDMKKQLLESIQTQKTLGVAYSNEADIVESANKLADKVIIELIKDEYGSGNITTQRLVMIVRRLIPEARDLKRLMPKIKVALLASGMSIDDYLKLVDELKDELESEELTRILQESSESIGVDGDALIDEFKRNPSQAAELIYLASEIRAGTGDTATLTSILVEYVEQLGGEMVESATDEEGEAHLTQVVSGIESGLMRQLSQLNVDTDVLTRMETRINERMEAILDKMRVDWLKEQACTENQQTPQALSVLQTLENHSDDDEEMSAILSKVRNKVESGEIGENDFSRIYAEIDQHKQRLKEKADKKNLNSDVLQSSELIYLLDKEIAKTKRYQTSFSVLAFSFVSAKPKIKIAKDALTNKAILEAALDELIQNFREVDFAGQIGKNKLLVILPMTFEVGAKTALSRVLNTLHAEPLMVDKIPVQLRVAGVAAAYDSDHSQDARTFARQLSNQLMDMVERVKNIQVLF